MTERNRPLSRRQFVRTAAAATAVVGWAPGLWTPARAAAARRIPWLAAAPAGTTLESTIVPTAGTGYRTLTTGPAWPIVVRDELGPPQSGRESRRRGVATVAHLTDIHVIDAQSPARVEFIDRFADAPFDSLPTVGAYRAHETLTTQVAASMVDRINAVGVGPISGRTIDCAVNTGDNIDNFQLNELQWYLGVLDGGIVTPNSGDDRSYEGVAATTNDGDVHYWHPDPAAAPDNYKTLGGFPSVDGLLEASIAPFAVPGLGFPWYSCYGNHDGLAQGNAATNAAIDAIAVGEVKVLGSTISGGDLQSAYEAQDPALFAAALGAPGAFTLVTPDADRRFVTPGEWVQAHLDSVSSPDGHGYPADAVASGILHYTFPIGDEVVGICLDTVNRGGYAEGSLGRGQFEWLEQELIGAHSRHLDAGGDDVGTSNLDRLVVLFSHHNLLTLDNPFPDPVDPEERVLGPEIRALLHRFPNVVLWVNGHSHVNRVTPYPDPSQRTNGFWELSTASHVDYPQQARIVELVDNADGTLSIFGTIVEHLAPPAPGDELDRLALASWSRELSYNEIQGDAAQGLGTANDLNVELVIPRPFDPTAGGASTTTTTSATEATGGGTLAATGGRLDDALLVGGALAAAAITLRQRGSGPNPADD